VLLVAVTLLVLLEQWRIVLPLGVFTYVLSGPGYLAYRFLRGRGVLGRRPSASITLWALGRCDESNRYCQRHTEQANQTIHDSSPCQIPSPAAHYANQ